MVGNISKTRGVLGATGPQGKQGPKGDAGEQGPKGDTPSIVLRYDPETGNLYYSSDGILIDKEYIESQNLVARDEVNELTQFVINLNSSFAGDKTYDEIVEAYKDGKEIIGVMPDMNITFRFALTAYSDTGVQLMAIMANSVLTIMCTSDNVWSISPVGLVTDIQLNNKFDSEMSKTELKANKRGSISAETSDTTYPSVRAVYNFVTNKMKDIKIETVTDITAGVTDEQYPSALAVKNYVDSSIGEALESDY